MRFTGSQAVNTLTIDHKETHNLSGATAMTVVTVTTAAAGAERPICGCGAAPTAGTWVLTLPDTRYLLLAAAQPIGFTRPT